MVSDGRRQFFPTPLHLHTDGCSITTHNVTPAEDCVYEHYTIFYNIIIYDITAYKCKAGKSLPVLCPEEGDVFLSQ